MPGFVGLLRTLMSPASDHNPGDAAPQTGHYEEHNVFGSPTGRIVHVSEGELLPRAARGFTWRLRSAGTC
jgi:hypothetical protein